MTPTAPRPTRTRSFISSPTTPETTWCSGPAAARTQCCQRAKGVYWTSPTLEQLENKSIGTEQLCCPFKDGFQCGAESEGSNVLTCAGSGNTREKLYEEKLRQQQQELKQLHDERQRLMDIQGKIQDLEWVCPDLQVPFCLLVACTLRHAGYQSGASDPRAARLRLL